MGEALWRALGICPGDVVAFTGGGGKTSAARRVARELLAEGRPVIFATTTKIFSVPDMELVLTGQGIGQGSESAALASVSAALAAGRNVCLGSVLEEGTGKLLGIDPALVDGLRGLGAGAVLIEADGSGQRPLKAPAAHEPVIPPCTDLVVPVAGASALGKELGQDMVHRPEETALAVGVEVGAVITPKVMADTLMACTRGTPPGARVVPLLSQADLAVDLAEVAGLLVGRHALSTAGSGAVVGRVVMAAPRTAEPVRGVVGDVSAVMLAGGVSRRFGSSKLLHRWGSRTILEQSLQAPLRAGLREVVVVTGAYHEALAQVLVPYPVRVVENPAWREGMSTSVKAGLQACEAPRAVMICLGDQPLLPPAVPAAVAEAHRRTGARVVAPAVGGVRKSPVLFDRSLFSELLAVEGDEGGRKVVQTHAADTVLLPYAEASWFHDIDTPGDLPGAGE